MSNDTLINLLPWGPPSRKTSPWHALRIPLYFVKFCGSCWPNGHLQGISRNLTPNVMTECSQRWFMPCFSLELPISLKCSAVCLSPVPNDSAQSCDVWFQPSIFLTRSPTRVWLVCCSVLLPRLTTTTKKPDQDQLNGESVVTVLTCY